MSFGYFTEGGLDLIVAEAFIPDPAHVNGRRLGNLAITRSAVQQLNARGEVTRVAQLQKILLPDLLITRHVFQGLRRPLLYRADRDGAAKKWVYSRKPAFDVIATPNPTGTEFVSKQVMPPDGQVVCAIVTPNIDYKKKCPSIDGWIERWSWVREDGGLPEAPQNWIDRYDQILFTIKESERITE